MAELETSLIVLAGGDSRRFGSPKATALWRGRRLVDHVVEGHGPRAAVTIVVANPTPEDPAWPGGLAVRDDLSLPAGPLRGIAAGLTECPTEWAWVLACDTPLVSAEILAELRRGARTGDVAVVPEWDGRRQPLVACWEKAASPALIEILNAGEHSPRAALDRLGCRILPAERCAAVDPGGRSFFNVNTPADLARLEGLAQRGD